jgi:hypothetical protein
MWSTLWFHVRNQIFISLDWRNMSSLSRLWLNCYDVYVCRRTSIFHWHYPSVRTMALKSTHKWLPGGEGGRCLGLPSVADCVEICEPHPVGTLRACSGLYRDCFTGNWEEYLLWQCSVSVMLLIDQSTIEGQTRPKKWYSSGLRSVSYSFPQLLAPRSWVPNCLSCCALTLLRTWEVNTVLVVCAVMRRVRDATVNVQAGVCVVEVATAVTATALSIVRCCCGLFMVTDPFTWNDMFVIDCCAMCCLFCLVLLGFVWFRHLIYKYLSQNSRIWH